jgi:hypothetical protein
MHNWYHSIIARILICTQDETCYIHGRFLAPPVPLAPVVPLAPLVSLVPLDTLTWNPPCCDRIRPPRPPVARELTLCPFVQPSWLSTQNPDPPRGFPDPNMY